MLLASSALLGGGVSAAVLAATGALDNASTNTTTIVRSASGTTRTISTSSGGGGVDAKALYAAASPGVVDITCKGAGSSDPSTPFGVPPEQQQSTATGTGFIVSSSGEIVTAGHVVDGASAITVTLQDGSKHKATVLGKDDATDVALLEIDASGLNLHVLALGSSSDLQVGDGVAAIGDPFGYARSISTGIVSGLDRTMQAPNGFTVAHAIQTDAALNPGNSGGPLLNGRGEVVGIVDQIATNGNADQSSGVGFAVPSSLVKAELDTLRSGGKVAHAYLGVASANAPTSAIGATLATVTPGGPAADAGLRSGDVVTRIGAAKIETSDDLVAAVADHEPGEKVPITAQRGGSTVTVTVTLGTQPKQSAQGG